MPVNKEWLDNILDSIDHIFNGAAEDKETKAEVTKLKADLTTTITELRNNDLSDASAKREAQESVDRLQAAIDAMVAKLVIAEPVEE